MLEKIKYMRELFERNPQYRKLSDFEKKFVIVRFFFSRLFFRTALIDYVQYNFFLLSRRGQKNFLSVADKKALNNRYNDQKVALSLDDKGNFYKKTASFVKRDYLIPGEASFEDFEAFIAKHPVFLVKPRDATYGIGIYKQTAKNFEDKKAAFQAFNENKDLYEEIVLSHAELAKFNPSSLNTLRLVSFLDGENQPHILGAAFRMGREGSVVDNNHSGGLSAIVDIETGMIYGPATNNKYERHLIHPDSGEKIVGFKIPHWDSFTSTAKQAAKLWPELGYIGWDIALDIDGQTEIIEANSSPDPDVLQLADQVGKKDFFESVLKAKL